MQLHHWSKLLLLIITINFTNQALAAPAQFNPGDRIECSPSGTGNYIKGTVAPWQEGDNLENVIYYRVHLDGWKYFSEKEATVCTLKNVRAAPALQETPNPPTPQTKPVATPNNENGATGSASPVSTGALEKCTVGQRVITPGGTQAVVIEVQGSGCKVRKDGVQYTDTYAAFMLEGIASSPSQATKEKKSEVKNMKGKYKCYYLSGTTLNYSLIDVNILSNTSYSDRNGKKGQYKMNGKDIIFTTGTFAQHPAYTKNGNIMLGTPGGSTYMTCSQ